MSEYFQALHNQEVSLTAIREVWEKTDIDLIELLLDVLQQEPTQFKKCIANLPDQWNEYIRDCAVVGLRQAVLEIHNEE